MVLCAKQSQHGTTEYQQQLDGRVNGLKTTVHLCSQGNGGSSDVPNTFFMFTWVRFVEIGGCFLPSQGIYDRSTCGQTADRIESLQRLCGCCDRPAGSEGEPGLCHILQSRIAHTAQGASSCVGIHVTMKQGVSWYFTFPNSSSIQPTFYQLL